MKYPPCKYCGTPMIPGELAGSILMCHACGHRQINRTGAKRFSRVTLRGKCECPGCNGKEVPKAGAYFCHLCYKLEPIFKDTEGNRFAFHGCKAFGGAVAEGVGENKREIETTDGAKVTIFPEEGEPIDFPEDMLRQKLEELRRQDGERVDGRDGEDEGEEGDGQDGGG